MCRINLPSSLFVSSKEKAARASSAASEAVRPRWTVSGGLMPGLMEYVSPIRPASRVWLGLPAREAALILAPHPADSQLHSEQLIRHGAAEAAWDRCGDEEWRFQSGQQEKRFLPLLIGELIFLFVFSIVLLSIKKLVKLFYAALFIIEISLVLYF